LIDTGEGKEEYLTVLASALREMAIPSDPLKPDVSDIILSHWHGDHIGGLPSVLKLLRQLWHERNKDIGGTYTPPRIHKFLSQSVKIDNGLQSIIDSLPTDSYISNPNGGPIHSLEDFKKLPLTTSASLPSGYLQILHTPGHTTDSIAIYVPSDRALYTADTVLGQGTAVFEDLASLIASLRKMRDFEGYTKVYPGHGPVVDDGPTLISTYIEHRMKREEEILQVLDSDGEGNDGRWSTWGIVSRIYAVYPQNLWEPAARSVDQHLKKLEKDEKVKHVGGEGKDAQWVLSGGN